MQDETVRPTRFSHSLSGRVQNRVPDDRASCLVRLYPAAGIGEFDC